MPEDDNAPAEETETEVTKEVAHAVIEATGDVELAAEVAEEVGELAEQAEVGDQVHEAVLEATGDEELAERAEMVAEVEVAIDQTEEEVTAPEPETATGPEPLPEAVEETVLPEVEPVMADTAPRRDHWYFRRRGGNA